MPQPLQNPGRHHRVEQTLTGGHPSDGRNQFRSSDLLEDVARSAGHDGGEERFVISEAGQHHASHLWVGRADLPAHLDTRALPEADIQYGDIGPGLGYALQRLLGGGRVPHHRHVVLGPEQIADPSAHQLVIVEQKHTNRHLSILPLLGGVSRHGGRHRIRQVVAVCLAATFESATKSPTVTTSMIKNPMKAPMAAYRAMVLTTDHPQA